MRLINVKSFKLKEFHGDKIPPYAILSHRWEEEEVSFRDWKKSGRERKLGFRKIELSCEQAIIDGHDWLWVDTCCIDKTSSAELSEAINSMFAWYANSERCYAFLSDVPTAHDKLNILRQFRESRWFTRGWTLQELLAPTNVIFYAHDWSKIGSRGRSMTKDITKATGIDGEYLKGVTSIEGASVAKKMSWVSRRETTRPEDIAYCMLGIFDINMPLLYGEGKKAFIRLQEEIIKVSNDQTIFCWKWDTAVSNDWTSILAPSPDVFWDFRNMIQKKGLIDTNSREVSTYQMTNAGLSIRLPTLVTMTGYIVALDATMDETGPGVCEGPGRAWIPVTGEDRHGTLHVSRMPYPTIPIMLEDSLYRITSQRTLIIKRRQDRQSVTAKQVEQDSTPPATDAQRTSSLRPSSSTLLHGRLGVYPAFQTSRLRDAWAQSYDIVNSYNYEKNILWLDSRGHVSRNVQSAAVQTQIYGTEKTAKDEWRYKQAMVWLGVWVEGERKSLVHYPWTCRIEPAPGLSEREDYTEKVETFGINLEDWKPKVSHRQLNLRVSLMAQVHGLGEGRVRFVAVARNAPSKQSWTRGDEAEFSDLEKEDGAFAVYGGSEWGI